MPAPTFDDDLGFEKREKDFSVEQLKSHLTVERFAVSILLWASGCDEERLHAPRLKPRLIAITKKTIQPTKK